MNFRGRGMWSVFVCLPETSRKSAEKADKMGISWKSVLSVSEQEIWEIGRGFNNVLMVFWNLPYDLLFDFGLVSA